MTKKQAFFSNAALLHEKFGIVPLMYGSLGLEYLTGENLNADDVDILIPEVFLRSRWSDFQTTLAASGYVLTNAREHTFEKEGIAYSYASIEELKSFAGISLPEIEEVNSGMVAFRILTLAQYQKVYTASSKDGYRRDIRKKKDANKLKLIENYLEKQEC